MEPFKVHILGCGSALPTLQHFPSCQIVEMRGKAFMVDCGEGAQIQLRKSHVAFSKIQAVLITHLHGDHCFGLIGMLSTFGLLGRTAPLHIYAPAELEDMLSQQMKLFCHDFDYDVVFHAVDTKNRAIIYEDKSLTIETIPLCHRVPCAGFLFREKPGLPHIRREMIDFYQIPISQINNIKMGADWTTDDGEHVPNKRLVTPPDPARSYAYCSDTSFQPQLAEQLHGVNLLYHEATYADDMQSNAEKYCHTTARQAGRIAKLAEARQLLLGHYSSRYTDEGVLLKEAKQEFENTLLSKEKMIVDVKAYK